MEFDSYIVGFVHSVATDSGVMLARELERYRVCLSIQQLIRSGLNKRDRREADNILERWLITLANRPLSSDEDESRVVGLVPRRGEDALFTTDSIDSSQPGVVKMIAEFRDKRIDVSTKLPAIFDILQKFSVSLALEEINEDASKPILRINKDTLSKLIKLNDSANDMYCLQLRYGCLLSAGQQWSIPQNIFDSILEEFDITIEAFASPFNSKILKYIVEEKIHSERSSTPPIRPLGLYSERLPGVRGSENRSERSPSGTPTPVGRSERLPGVRGSENRSEHREYGYSKGYAYCSLFHDTDHSYGSLGSFFSFDARGRNVFANPPFTLSILDATTAKILDDCENSVEVTHVMVVPEWADADFHSALRESQYLICEHLLEGGSYYYVDPDDRRIPASFRSRILVLSNVEGIREDTPRYMTFFSELQKLYK